MNLYRIELNKDGYTVIENTTGLTVGYGIRPKEEAEKLKASMEQDAQDFAERY